MSVLKRTIFSIICVIYANFGACAIASESLKFQEITYAELAGWQLDQHGFALESFLRSCNKPRENQSELSKLVNAVSLKLACFDAKQVSPTNHAAARGFFEQHFQPYRLHLASGKDTGLLTGYFIPVIRGSREPSARYTSPAYAIPNDMTKPYYTRAEIASGVLNNKGLELLYLDPIDLFFMQVQGSGRVQLDTGEMVTLQFAGKNGHPYTSIGRVLVEMGELKKGDVSLKSIHNWLNNNPSKAQDVMNRNASYIFFSLNESPDMPSGAQGVPLTAERSLAVDPSQMPYGVPIYLQTKTKRNGQEHPFNKLVVTQDTGSAIRGPMRGDIFFGQGSVAGAIAGEQKFQGGWTVLIPKGKGL